ncbi:MAG: hypothetical protein WC952_16910 [Desulfobulbaceae bacterium]
MTEGRKHTDRSCENCNYYKPDYGIWCFNGWSRDGRTGHCHYEPKRVAVSGDDKCHNFERRR